MPKTKSTFKKSKKLKALEVEMDELGKIQLALKKKINAARGDQMAVCHECDKRFQVKTLVYNQQHYYVPPSGCTDGAYWTESEADFICPSCGTRNRLIFRKELDALKSYFKSVNDVYLDQREQHAEDRKAGRTFVN